jgi:hypothetical protein
MEYGFDIAGKLREVKVSVGVDEHRWLARKSHQPNVVRFPRLE